MSGRAARLRQALLVEIPSLRAFAISLTHDPDRAGDLVQETLVKAWAAFDSFAEGRSLRAWLFTIMRNAFYSLHRKRRREVQDVEGRAAARLTCDPTQLGHLDLADFRAELAALPIDQREALILVGASGFTYAEAATITGSAVGTVKSRVFRARRRLMERLTVTTPADFGPDRAATGAAPVAMTYP